MLQTHQVPLTRRLTRATNTAGLNWQQTSRHSCIVRAQESDQVAFPQPPLGTASSKVGSNADIGQAERPQPPHRNRKASKPAQPRQSAGGDDSEAPVQLNAPRRWHTTDALPPTAPSRSTASLEPRLPPKGLMRAKYSRPDPKRRSRATEEHERMLQLQQGQGMQGTPGMEAHAGSSTASPSTSTSAKSRSSANEEYDEGEAIAMSQEELDQMLFGDTSSWLKEPHGEDLEGDAARDDGRRVPGGAPSDHAERRASGRGASSSNNNHPMGGEAASLAALLTAMQLPSALQAAVLEAGAAGLLPNAADRSAKKLAAFKEQLHTLLASPALQRGAAPKPGEEPNQSTAADCTAAWAMVGSWVQAAQSGLNLTAPQAVTLVITHPQYLQVPIPELRSRMEALGNACQVGVVRLPALIAGNPALLLIAHEPLVKKLDAFKKATGLSLEQATAMVSLYMFR